MLAEKICKIINPLFKVPVHPFNLNNEGIMTYSEWQYEKGKETIKYYLEHASEEEIFKGKMVLDIGCGAGGKTIYYASKGVDQIVGLEILEKYREQANSLAAEKNMADRFSFVCKNATDTGFPEGYFDTIIMNDAIEHVADPIAVLKECYRVLKKGGRLYLNFPPFNHPYGAHLRDIIGIPWVHCFFSDRTLINVYKDLVKDLPDGQDRVKFRIAKDEKNEEYFCYLNKMSLKRFKGILTQLEFKTAYYQEVPLRSFVAWLAKVSFLKEFLLKEVVVILEKK